MTGAGYPLFIAFTFFVFRNLLPQPAGSIILFGLWSVQMSWFAITFWRRTGLQFVTAAMVIGAVMFLCLAVLAAARRPYQEMSTESWALMIGAGVSAMLLIHIESRVNKSKVKQWRDNLTGRHIPYLRD